jgi:ABC-type amino acid transport substrate-binding protein
MAKVSMRFHKILNIAASTAILLASFSHLRAQGTLSNQSDKYPTIQIGSQEIPMAYWEGGDGDYNKILDYILADYPGKVEITFLPSTRLTKFFTEGDLDCTYVSTDGFREGAEFIGPINTISVTAYTRNELPDISKPEDLQSIPFAIDVNLVDLVKRNALKPAMSLQSQEQMIDLLAKGRIDALVGYDYDLDLLVKEMNHTDKLKKASVVFAELKDGMMCHKTEKTKLFRNIVMKNILKAEKEGFFEAIFDK